MQTTLAPPKDLYQNLTPLEIQNLVIESMSGRAWGSLVWQLGTLPLDLKTYGLKRPVIYPTIIQYAVIARDKIA